MFREKLKVHLKFAPLFLFFTMTFTLYHNCSQYSAVDISSVTQRILTGEILINDGADYTKDLTVNISFIYSELPSEIFISVIAECYLGSWEVFTPTKSIELKQANQLNTIYVKYKFADEQESPCFNNSITHDDIPPDLILNYGPPLLTSDLTPDFGLSAMDTGSGIARLECLVDNQIQFSSCQKEFSLNNLPNGLHKIEIRAIDNVEMSKTISHIWTQDTSTPTIQFTQTPSNISKESTAQFRFEDVNSLHKVSSYECQVDSEAKQPCASPHNLRNLSDGQHRLIVIGLDSTGNYLTSSSYLWTIDQSPPTITINSQPENSPNDTSASFTFQAKDSGSGVEKIECRLDNNPSFTTCPGSKSYTNLSTGQHDFYVRAKDLAGNFSPVKTYTWYIGVSDVLGCKTVDPTNLTSTPTNTYPKGTRNAYPTKILKGKNGSFYYLAWVWRETGGVQTNHSLSVIRSKNLRTWSNTCGESITLPIATSSKTVLDPLPQESGLGNNVQLGFDLNGNPIVSYHKFTTLNGKKTTQIYNAHFINNKWTIHQMTEWTVLKELSGGGSLPRSDDGVSFSRVQIAPTGNIYQVLRAWSSDNSSIGSPASGTWILEYSNNRLQVTNRKFSYRNTGDDFQSISRKQLPQSALEAENRNFENFETTFNVKKVWASYNSDWVHLYGDWDNDGNTDSGLFDRRLSIFYLYDVSDGSNFINPFQFGNKSKYFWPLVGTWGNNNTTSIGLWSPSEGVSYIKRQPSSGPADQTIQGSLPSGLTDSPLIWHSRRPDLTHFIKYDVLPGNRDLGYNCDGTKRTDDQMPTPSSCWNRFHTKLYLYEYDVENNDWKTPTLIDSAWGGAKASFFLKIFKDIKIIVYYDINRKIKVAFKKKNSDWQKQIVDTSITFDGWDGHNHLAAEIDLNNNIHITGNMHADSMKYWISNGLNLNTFTRQNIQPAPGGTTYPQPDPGKITYPSIFRGPLGKLFFLFRIGGSGNGKWKIIEYNESTKSWSSFSRDDLFDNI